MSNKAKTKKPDTVRILIEFERAFDALARARAAHDKAQARSDKAKRAMCEVLCLPYGNFTIASVPSMTSITSGINFRTT